MWAISHEMAHVNVIRKKVYLQYTAHFKVETLYELRHAKCSLKTFYNSLIQI